MSAPSSVQVTLEAGAPPGLDPAYLQRLARYALAQLNVAGRRTLSIVITDDAAIQRLHAAHLGINAPTDILTFRLDDDDGFVSAEREPLLGEIVISAETAAANAAEVNHPVGREIAFLVLHGILHLLGYDDQTAEERGAMLDRQEQILTDFERSDHATA